MIGNQRGGALIVVMMVGIIIAAGFVSFIGGNVLTESRAVEGELARSRAYWAQMGNFNYAFSRIGYSKLCNGCTSSNNLDTNWATVLQAYFNELSNLQTWSYPDESANYTITTATPTGTVDPTPGRQVHSGWLMATASISSSSLVSGLNSHLPAMELRFCAGLTSSGANCGAVTNNNGGSKTSYFSISRLTNLGG
jgi:hypothetical protein